jgi:hypothetical protein
MTHLALLAFHLSSRIAIEDAGGLTDGAFASSFTPKHMRSGRLLLTQYSYVTIVTANAAALITANFTQTSAFHSTTNVPMVAIATWCRT